MESALKYREKERLVHWDWVWICWESVRTVLFALHAGAGLVGAQSQEVDRDRDLQGLSAEKLLIQ